MSKEMSLLERVLEEAERYQRLADCNGPSHEFAARQCTFMRREIREKLWAKEKSRLEAESREQREEQKIKNWFLERRGQEREELKKLAKQRGFDVAGPYCLQCSKKLDGTENHLAAQQCDRCIYEKGWLTPSGWYNTYFRGKSWLPEKERQKKIIMNKQVEIELELSDDTIKELDRAAREEGKTRDQIINDALRSYMVHIEKQSDHTIGVGREFRETKWLKRKLPTEVASHTRWLYRLDNDSYGDGYYSATVEKAIDTDGGDIYDWTLELGFGTVVGDFRGSTMTLEEAMEEAEQLIQLLIPVPKDE